MSSAADPPNIPRGCLACERPFAARGRNGPRLCPSCHTQARRTLGAERARARESLEALLDHRNSNALLPLYQAARDAVAALVQLEASGALPGHAAAWLSQRMDDGRQAALSLALRGRLGADEDRRGRRELKRLVRSYLEELNGVGAGFAEEPPGAAAAPYSELRQHRRAAAHLPVHLDPGDRNGTSRDLSPGGAFVCCSPLPPVGQQLTLTFFAGETRRSTFARVRWATAEGIGVEFAREQVGTPFEG